MTGGQALARQLVIEGVTDIFGIPGVQLDWATDALIDVADRIRFIVPRHEQAASYMADGYARTTGREGVCMVVPGPGVLNALSGLATAYACSSRVLCIAGQIPSATLAQGYGMLHEVPGQSEVLKSVTKWSALARTPADIPRLVHEAFVQMRSGHPRPVALEIPPDVLQARGEVQLCEAAAPAAPQAPAREAVAEAAKLLAAARSPVIWAGGGVLAAQGAQALERLAQKLRAPVVMTDNGRGALPQRHPLALLNLGGRCVLPHADVVLVAGSRAMDAIGRPAHAAAGVQYIYLNIDPAHTGAPRAPGLALVGDAAAGLDALADALDAVPASAPRHDLDAVRAWCDEQVAYVEPQRSILAAIRAALPDDGILVSELTQVGYAANFAYPVQAPRTLVSPGYQGTLGYGFPTSLGVALGSKGRRVVSISGDGGFGWGLQELATAAKYRPDLAIVVFADGAFGNVRRIQQNVFQRETDTTLTNPDFVALAAAFGIEGESVDSVAGLSAALERALAQGGPRLIEMRVGAMPGPWHLIHTFSKAPRPAPANPLGEAATAASGTAPVHRTESPRLRHMASNENPLGIGPMAMAAARDCLAGLAAYPDPSGAPLKAALARRFGLAAEGLVIGNGSSELIDLVTRSFVVKGDEVVYSQYSFIGYPHAVKSAGGASIVVPARDYGHDLDAMLSAVTPRTRVAFVANPNNPTGTLLEEAAIVRFLEAMPARVLVVLDEAYTEYLPEAARMNAFALLKRFPNLVVMRTFSKAHGMAGLRVGFAAASAEVAQLMNRARLAYNVNAPAQAAAIAALDDAAFLQRSYEVNEAGKRRLSAALGELGIPFIPSWGNFVAADFSGITGGPEGVNAYLQSRGLLVRPLGPYGLPTHLRFTIGLPDDNEALVAALADYLKR
ncbi:histidinol-phosphate transaminase [Ramlibacter agri]|nr:histidinol-phosphate transaminase [Ramlibacter agri]